MNFRKLLFLLTFLGFAFSGFSQPDWLPGFDSQKSTLLRFEAITAEQGLPHQKVNTIFQDYLGFIWLGTPLGLSRYDGYAFQTYQFQTRDTLSEAMLPVNIDVKSIVEDAFGDLWLGCTSDRSDIPVLFRFDRETERLIPYLFEENASTRKLSILELLIKGGYLWMRTPALFRVRLPEYAHGGQVGEALILESIGEEGKGIQSNWVGNLYEDSKGRFWLPSRNGLQEWIPEPDTFRFHHLPIFSEEDQELSYNIYDIAEGQDGGLWVFPNLAGHIMLFYPEKEEFEIIKSDQYSEIGNSRYISRRHALSTTSGQIWLGQRAGRGGMVIFDPATGEMDRVEFQVDGRKFFPLERILSLYQDDSGIIWIGTEYGPLLKYESQRDHFHWLHFKAENENSISHNMVTGIQQDSSGHYWLSTFGGGLNRWDRVKNTYTHFRALPGDPNGPISDFLSGIEILPDNRIWFGEGFLAGVFDPQKGTFRHYIAGGGITWDFASDAENNLWVTKDTGGMIKFDAKNDRFVTVKIASPEDSLPTPQVRLRNIFKDSRGKLWIQTFEAFNSGFYQFDPESEKLTKFNRPEAQAFFEDQHGFIWIGTVNGLFRYDPETEHLKRYGKRDGLSNNQVLAIQEDDSGRLWLGTNNGLSCFDPKTDSFHHYFQSDGLPANAFNVTNYKNERGELFFAGDFGVVYFHPDSIRKNDIPPQLVFTGIDLFGKPIPVDENGPLKQHFSVTEELHFAYWQNDLTLHYAALHFKNPKKNNYQVRLENYDEEWQEPSNQNFVNYTNLDPGQYTFRVRAANSDGIWNEQQIAMGIIISPPWFWNIWSQALYLLLILGGITALYRFQFNRRLALAEAGRLRELDEAKTKLYTNITHEFRTPLTVIQGVSEQISGYHREKELIRRNIQNLLELVNRILDLSKASVGKLKLRLRQGDILPFLRYVTESFHSLALNQKINLNFHTDLEALDMDYDPEKILQVLSNLISNAIKFTPEYGKVTITARKKIRGGVPHLDIRVKDTGIGMEAEQLPFIFDRFHQVDAGPTRRAEGTGIGLALTRELVHLMRGEIRVESRPGVGSLFTVVLPITNEAVRQVLPEQGSLVPAADPAPSLEEAPGKNSILLGKNGSGEERPRLLIVEDNQDVMQFIVSCLQNDYELLTARNGREGIEQALEHIPDIIISDVMMPEADGFELCHTLKQDERTDHIPIILLTAKADQDSKLEGLEYGADAYLVKPFHRTELEIRLRKLIELRRRLQARYQEASLETEPTSTEVDPFILKARRAVMDHLSDENFGPEELSRILLVHRSQLHRKLKALTGESTSIFIRQIRLQEANKLLAETDHTVKEVAYEVGFSDPGYFSKLFSEKYGRPPSEV